MPIHKKKEKEKKKEKKREGVEGSYAGSSTTPWKNCKKKMGGKRKPSEVSKDNSTNYFKKEGHAAKTNLMQYHGFVGKFNQRLWCTEGQRPQPCSKPSNKN